MAGETDEAMRSRRAVATARRLREAARAAFAEHGYGAARVADVVAGAGVSHGTFYTYYENKGDVLDALVDETAQRLLAVVEASWEGPDAASAVRDVIARFVAVFAEDGDVIRTWVEAAAQEVHFARRLEGVRRGYVARVADQIRPVLAGTGHDPEVAAAALVAMVEGYVTERFADAPPEARDGAVRTLAAIWFGGLKELTRA